MSSKNSVGPKRRGISVECRLRVTLPKKKKKEVAGVPVYLNVYDMPFRHIPNVNSYLYWLGLGAYHTAVQVHDLEYFYAAGIMCNELNQCHLRLRKSIFIGRTELGAEEVDAFFINLSQEYSGSAYQILTKNCNHFSNDVCQRLTGKPIPSWINRLALVLKILKPSLAQSTSPSTAETNTRDVAEQNMNLSVSLTSAATLSDSSTAPAS